MVIISIGKCHAEGSKVHVLYGLVYKVYCIKKLTSSDDSMPICCSGKQSYLPPCLGLPMRCPSLTHACVLGQPDAKAILQTMPQGSFDTFDPLLRSAKREGLFVSLHFAEALHPRPYLRPFSHFRCWNWSHPSGSSIPMPISAEQIQALLHECQLEPLTVQRCPATPICLQAPCGAHKGAVVFLVYCNTLSQPTG